MLLIPAIFVKEGKCVSLQQGYMNKYSIFSDKPAEMALKWQQQGAKALHLVDLNAAFTGANAENKSAILEIINSVDSSINIQLGGGIRDLKTIEYWLDKGVQSVIIGTSAIKDPIFLKDACQIFPGSIMVGLDTKDGFIAIDGWAKITKYTAIDTAKKFADYGINAIIYTDISRDGMLQGINIPATVELAKNIDIPIIASGGLSKIDEIKELCNVQDEGIAGVICGKSIYSGDINFIEAQKIVSELAQNNSLSIYNK